MEILPKLKKITFTCIILHKFKYIYRVNSKLNCKDMCITILIGTVKLSSEWGIPINTVFGNIGKLFCFSLNSFQSGSHASLHWNCIYQRHKWPLYCQIQESVFSLLNSNSWEHQTLFFLAFDLPTFTALLHLSTLP